MKDREKEREEGVALEQLHTSERANPICWGGGKKECRKKVRHDKGVMGQNDWETIKAGKSGQDEGGLHYQSKKENWPVY